jgi:hypothetical protein
MRRVVNVMVSVAGVPGSFPATITVMRVANHLVEIELPSIGGKPTRITVTSADAEALASALFVASGAAPD